MDELKLAQVDLDISKLGKATFDLRKTTEQNVSCVREDDEISLHVHSKAINEALSKKIPLPMLELAGPRQKLYFDPTKTRIGVVTCGGLCPGLNTIIRAIVFTAYNFYGVTDVIGFRNGYYGLNPASGLKPIQLTPDLTDTIHEQGGTILSSSRGPQESAVMAQYLNKLGVNILFVVGGDGTMRGAQDLVREIKRRKLDIAVIGIPKTIDNDIALVERSFGFETAVEEAARVIRSAHVESKGAPNGVGLVKLMGRDSGFIAAAATIASAVVNFCLVPEVAFTLPKFLAVLEKRIKKREHAVIVVAEGAGQEFFAGNESTDASGNKRLQDIGHFLKSQIEEYFKKKNTICNVKYIDPSYIIRSVPANADDNVYCTMLAQNAVHAAMSGRTEMVVAYRNDHYVHLPMGVIVRERRKINPAGRTWKTVLDATGQPERMI